MLPAGCFQFPVSLCCRTGETWSVMNSLDYFLSETDVWGLCVVVCLFLSWWGG